MQRLFLCLFLGQEVGIWKILASQRDIQSWNQPNVLRRVAGDKRTQTDRPARGACSKQAEQARSRIQRCGEHIPANGRAASDTSGNGFSIASIG